MLRSHNKHFFTVAGMSTEFRCDPATAGLFPTAYGEGVLPGEERCTRIEVRLGGIPKHHEMKKLFDSGRTWALYESCGQYVLSNHVLEWGSPAERALVLDRDFASGRLHVPEKAFHVLYTANPLPYPLDQVFTIMLLSRGRGFLLHACGIDDNGAGYLFLGNSGHGKSTMAKLWHDRGASVLNDDRIVLREKEGAFWMYGTPWHGDFKEHSAQGLPVQKIFFLSRGDRNKAFPKYGADAVSMLLTRSFPPLWDKEGMAFTMGFCHGVTQKAPCCELYFVPDERIIDFVRNT